MIRTVLGDVDPATLGLTDYHEHAFQSSPLLPGDELKDESLSRTELEQLRESGFDAMIDATPIGLGRRTEALARLSEQTGLLIVASTGVHRDAHYESGSNLHAFDENALVELFTREIEIGMASDDRELDGRLAHSPAGVPVRAGLVKTGIGYWQISAREETVLRAAARTHAQTGAPIMVHLESGSAAFEVIQLLAALSVPAEAVVLAHIDRNPDPQLHAALAREGVYLGYDGFARSREWPDSILLECLVSAARAGASERLLLGGDVARSGRYSSYGGMPGLRYLGSRVVPRLRERAGASFVRRVLVENPARFLDRFPAHTP